jgi:hypothetical protein
MVPEEEILENEGREKLLYDVAAACYTMYPQITSEVDEIVSDPISFKALLGGFIFLYEKYKGIPNVERRH